MQDAGRRWGQRSWYTRLGLYKGNVEANCYAATAQGTAGEVPDLSVFNGLSVMQGPNYALAKTLQQWRAILAKRDYPHMRVSFNFAPPARTESMTHNRVLATALDGMQHFEPLLILHQTQAAAVMTILLVADLQAEETTLNPACPAVSTEHPWDLLTFNAFHGGSWRCGYAMESIQNTVYVHGQLWPRKTPNLSGWESPQPPSKA